MSHTTEPEGSVFHWPAVRPKSKKLRAKKDPAKCRVETVISLMRR